MTRSWIACAECVNGTRVKVHQIDAERGFIHGYLVNGISAPQSWALVDGEIITGLLSAEYNLVMDTLTEIN